jgi:hypothetical protein
VRGHCASMPTAKRFRHLSVSVYRSVVRHRRLAEIADHGLTKPSHKVGKLNRRQ